MAYSSAAVISSPLYGALPLLSEGKQKDTPIRIGIIGAENSHTIWFGKLFNVQKAFPGLSVDYVWGETEALAQRAMKKGNIPKAVEDPLDMLGKIDALIVDHRHGKYHLEAALPFIEARIPTFIDKPFCYRVEEGKKFLSQAREWRTPVTSYSGIAHSYECFDIKDQLDQMGDIKQVVRYGPVDLNSQYGGIFFYGPHIIQPLIYLFDVPVKKVRITNNGAHSGANMIFENGLHASLVFTTKTRDWHTYVETEKGIVELLPTKKYEGTPKNYVDMVTMFKTGQEPRSHESILHGVAILEALEKSVASDTWESVAM